MKVAIAGYGIEGKASYRYWVNKGMDVTVVDERDIPANDLPANCETKLGKGAFQDLYGFDVVVRTASLPPTAIKTHGKIWSATNEFFAQCPAPIIGVTGTKGKGTTCSLIASILRAAGRKVHLVGNIGNPALALLDEITPDDIVVYELSSFQLWDLHRSPAVAVILMLEADHLDVHADFEDYLKAKSHIRMFQTADDVCFYHPFNSYSDTVAHATTVGDIIRYGIEEDGAVYISSNNFCVHSDLICSVDALQLPGAHNLENACAAISAARIFTVDNVAIECGLRSFSGLDHRLKFVGEVDGVKYYDDSIATTPGSAMAALKSFSQPKVVILGGSDKGAMYDEIVDLCKATETSVVAIGTTGAKIAELCTSKGVAVVRLVTNDMRQILSAARTMSKPGSVVVLSPASASFDQFASYAERGEKFIEAVKALDRKHTF